SREVGSPELLPLVAGPFQQSFRWVGHLLDLAYHLASALHRHLRPGVSALPTRIGLRRGPAHAKKPECPKTQANPYRIDKDWPTGITRWAPDFWTHPPHVPSELMRRSWPACLRSASRRSGRGCTDPARCSERSVGR